MEYQVAMPEGVVRLVVTYLSEPDFTSATVWPEHLADDCRRIELLQGYAPARMQFSPETWMTVVASTRSAAGSAPTSPEAGGGLIAFTSERDGEGDICIVNADGSEPRCLTDDPAYDGWPTWSPDGKQIAFVSDRSGNPDIYVMNDDGTKIRQLTQHSANDIWPEWSPDGSRIAFPSRRDGNFEIYVIDADGSNLQRLTNTPSHEDFPAWSPDGTQIVFSRVEGNDGTYVMDADGVEPGSRDEQQLTDIVALEPAWSPDGTRIAFGSDHEGFRAIYVMDADGSNLQKLSNTRAGENCPAWSPDGTRIAFASWRDGDGEIYVMDADGGNPLKLTDNRFEDEFPAWQPVSAAAPVVGSPALFRDLEARADVRTYGGEHNDYLYDILLLADGGTLLAGQANNTGLSHRITPGNARLVRTDSEGNAIWEKDYGGDDDAMFYSLVQVGEDEYVVLGQIAASYARQETDFYLIKVDGEGNEIWSHTYGGRGMDGAKMVRQTSDGGFVLTGGRADEFPTGDLYQANIVLIKTDAEGNEIWTRTYGDRTLYLGWGVAQTPDGGYVLIGWEAKTYSDRDVIAIKTDELGDVEWSRTWDLDPGDRDEGNDLILTSDGHIVIACIRSEDSGPRGAVLIKVDLDGNEIWTRHFGEEGVGNEFWDIMEDSDGGYVMAGATLPGEVAGIGEDRRSGLVIKTDPDGELLWDHVFEMDEYEQLMFSSAVVLPEGGYIFVGRATRKGDRYADMLWLKLTTDGTPVPPTHAAALPTKTDEPVLDAISVDTVDQVERLHTLSGHSDRVMSLAFSGDGAYVASSSLDSTIKLWDVRSGQEVHTFLKSVNEAVTHDIAISPDGSWLASANAVWDVESEQVVHTLEQGRCAAVTFSPDGLLLAVALVNQPVKLWDVASGQVVRTFDRQADNAAFSIVFSPDGALLAAGGLGGTVRLWDVESGQIADTLEYGDETGVHDVAFSPDGRALASGGTDSAVRLWDVANGQAVRTLGLGDGLFGVAFSPDGTILASAGGIGGVRLWDVESGGLLRTLPHDDELMAVAFSPDGTLLASGGYDNQICLWGVPR